MLGYNIILCGFMGCGKTAVGKKLAKKLQIPFVDMDKFIEEKCGKTIAKIFSEQGEEHFRMLEREACEELCNHTPCVISAGGGTLLNSENARILSSSGRIVMIDVPLNVLEERLKRDKRRPLLMVENKDEVIRKLFSERLPVYKSRAGVIVDGTPPIGAVAKNIIIALKIKRNTGRESIE